MAQKIETAWIQLHPIPGQWHGTVTVSDMGLDASDHHAVEHTRRELEKAFNWIYDRRVSVLFDIDQ